MTLAVRNLVDVEVVAGTSFEAFQYAVTDYIGELPAAHQVLCFERHKIYWTLYFDGMALLSDKGTRRRS